jgi:hypothetical protein
MLPGHDTAQKGTGSDCAARRPTADERGFRHGGRNCIRLTPPHTSIEHRG